MPRGVVISADPAPLVERCKGTVVAIERDDNIGIDIGVTYEFNRGSGNCCNKHPGDIIEILNKFGDGSVNIRCEKKFKVVEVRTGGKEEATGVEEESTKAGETTGGKEAV
ncbi:hypothetical protein ACD591_02760 [Rufibacter glacialis]|uniref:Uncharacterized protein n=1 Tax=Rufibacter glacialis TaxID=1259555 RepID=A0A5M8QMG4_9BACT|nr:hypothetical protein [Rufibacter glacialis]KAA6435803.1 hypothetical protein FOE74_07660 [Rufibacter glacialis]GGK66700.1 hypothetical protein GCM10011405_13300 [Rufibacter glacialis]